MNGNLGSCVNSANVGPKLTIPGNQVFYSPPTNRNGDSIGKNFLPGSCLLVPDLLTPQYPPICDDIEQSSSVLNVSCCFLLQGCCCF